MAQFYWQFCQATGKTMRELGELRRTDPEGYEFLDAAFSEANRRSNEAMRKIGKSGKHPFKLGQKHPK